MALPSENNEIPSLTNFRSFSFEKHPATETDIETLLDPPIPQNDEATSFETSGGLNDDESSTHQNEELEQFSDMASGDSDDNLGSKKISSGEAEAAEPSFSIIQELEFQRTEIEKARLEIHKLKTDKDAITKKWKLAANTNFSLTEQRDYNLSDKYFIAEWTRL
jgi:hypothetical protein